MKKIDIKYACNQSWSSMETVEQGINFCNKCEKNVNDYSNRKLSSNVENNSCGRFDLGQVRKIEKSIHLPRASFYAASVMSLFGISYLTTPLMAQENEQSPFQAQSAVSSIKISGTVRNPYDQSRVPDVLIKVLLDEKVIVETKSLFNGTFEITVDTLDLNFKDLQLVFSANEFEPDSIQTKTITSSMLSNGLDIQLESVYDCFKPHSIELGVTGKMKQAEPIYNAPPIPRK